MNFLMGQHHPIGASVWMHVFCSYSCAVKREIVLKAPSDHGHSYNERLGGKLPAPIGEN